MKARSIGLVGSSLLCTVILCACGTNPNAAFPSVQAVAAASASRDVDIGTLARGRKIFTTACTECHVAQPIARLSVEQWRKIVAVMAPRARLKAEDRAAVETYLTAARASLSGS